MTEPKNRMKAMRDAAYTEIAAGADPRAFAATALFEAARRFYSERNAAQCAKVFGVLLSRITQETIITVEPTVTDTVKEAVSDTKEIESSIADESSNGAAVEPIAPILEPLALEAIELALEPTTAPAKHAGRPRNTEAEAKVLEAHAQGLRGATAISRRTGIAEASCRRILKRHGLR